jgi:hypothetical protein
MLLIYAQILAKQRNVSEGEPVEQADALLLLSPSNVYTIIICYFLSTSKAILE